MTVTEETEPETLGTLLTLLETAQVDYVKFYCEGNASAGTRIRKTMQQVKTLAQEVRLHVQETKNTD